MDRIQLIVNYKEKWETIINISIKYYALDNPSNLSFYNYLATY